MTIARRLVLGAVLASSAAFIGCEGAPRTASTAEVLAPSSESPETAMSPADGARSVASPENEKSRMRKAAFAKATEGLEFGVDRVIVEPNHRNDPNFALIRTAQAYDLLEQGYDNDALAAFTDAIRSKPDSAAAYVGLGQALSRGKSDKALAAFRTALELEPGNVEARYYEGQILWQQGDHAAAMDVWRETVELMPLHGKAHERLAIGSYYAGDIESARTHAEAAEAAGERLPPQFVTLIR